MTLRTTGKREDVLLSIAIWALGLLFCAIFGLSTVSVEGSRWAAELEAGGRYVYVGVVALGLVSASLRMVRKLRRKDYPPENEQTESSNTQDIP